MSEALPSSYEQRRPPISPGAFVFDGMDANAETLSSVSKPKRRSAVVP